MTYIVIFTKTSTFYIDVVKNFLLHFKNIIVVINFNSDLNCEYIKFLNKQKIKYIKHPFKKKVIQTNTFINKLLEFSIDYIFTIYYPQILTKDIINLAKKNAYNFHPARLPNQRGAHILNWLLINNEKESLVTVHKLEETIDSGKILFEKKYTILFTDTINDLIEKTNKIALIIIKDLHNILNNNLYENNGINKYYHPRNIADSKIDINKHSLLEIYNLNRALIKPYPGIFWYKNNIKYTNNKFIKFENINEVVLNNI